MGQRLLRWLAAAASAAALIGAPPSARGGDAARAAPESQKLCGCPVMPDERILLPCKSTVRPEACGACSVLTEDGKRTGRPCVTLPYEPSR